jgi:hypothetical protein
LFGGGYRANIGAGIKRVVYEATPQALSVAGLLKVRTKVRWGSKESSHRAYSVPRGRARKNGAGFKANGSGPALRNGQGRARKRLPCIRQVSWRDVGSSGHVKEIERRLWKMPSINSSFRRMHSGVLSTARACGYRKQSSRVVGRSANNAVNTDPKLGASFRACLRHCCAKSRPKFGSGYRCR